MGLLGKLKKGKTPTSTTPKGGGSSSVRGAGGSSVAESSSTDRNSPLPQSGGGASANNSSSMPMSSRRKLRMSAPLRPDPVPPPLFETTSPGPDRPGESPLSANRISPLSPQGSRFRGKAAGPDPFALSQQKPSSARASGKLNASGRIRNSGKNLFLRFGSRDEVPRSPNNHASDEHKISTPRSKNESPRTKTKRPPKDPVGGGGPRLSWGANERKWREQPFKEGKSASSGNKSGHKSIVDRALELPDPIDDLELLRSKSPDKLRSPPVRSPAKGMSPTQPSSPRGATSPTKAMKRRGPRNAPPPLSLTHRGGSSQSLVDSELCLSIADSFTQSFRVSEVGSVGSEGELSPTADKKKRKEAKKPKNARGGVGGGGGGKRKGRPTGLKHVGGGAKGNGSGSSADGGPQVDVFLEDGRFQQGGFCLSRLGIDSSPVTLHRQHSAGVSFEGIPHSSHLPMQIKSLDELKVIQVIGAGAAGRVMLSRHRPTGTYLAVKQINVYDEEKRQQLEQELHTLSSLASRFLVRFHSAFYDGRGAVHVALEYMDLGSLSSVIRRLGAIPEKIVNHIAFQCLHGLHFLHGLKVLHRDFKTANILISRKLCRAKLSDFGLARNLDGSARGHSNQSHVNTFVGTMAYMSPERLNGSKYTYASDIWALGVSIAECLLGRTPWENAQNYFDYIEATQHESLERLVRYEKFSPKCKDFLRVCTSVNPDMRPRTEQLLQHPWITDTRRDLREFSAWMDTLAK